MLPRLDFKGITHVITNPAGHAPGWNYSLVGSVPLSLLQDETGRRRQWETVQAIIDTAPAHGATLCNSLTCACRKLF